MTVLIVLGRKSKWRVYYSLKFWITVVHISSKLQTHGENVKMLFMLLYTLMLMALLRRAKWIQDERINW